MRQPFLGLALAAALGTIAADLLPSASTISLLLAFAAVIVALRWPFTPLVFVCVAATFFLLHSSRVAATAGDALAERVGDAVRPVNAIGVVVTEPKIEANGTATFLVKLRHITIEAEKFPTDATVFVHWRGKTNIGDQLEMFGTLEPIAAPRNPGEFDMRAYLARRDVKRSLIVRYPENCHLLQSGSRFSLLRTAARSREWMQRQLSRDLEDSPDVIGLICGTALGLRHQTRDDIEEPFQQTGTLHLFAVAGLHVGIVARLLWTVAVILRLPRKTATALVIPLLFFYAAVTGLHTASIRAAVMTAILLGGIFFDRKVFALNSLAAAAFLVLLWDSNQLFTSGFQLSFAVVGAIVLLADPLFVKLRRIAAPDPFLPRVLLGRIRRVLLALAHAIARGTSVSVAAWIGSLPLIYWYFHLITPVSLVANLVVVPIAYFVLALAMLSLIAAPVSTALSIVFNNANWLMSRGVLILVHLFAVVPGGHIYLPRATELRSSAAITVLDEGSGGAAHVRAHQYHWLIDCGPRRSYQRTLESFLHSRGVNRLEGMLLTHGDARHIGAAADVVADFSPREIYDNPLQVRSVGQRQVLKLFQQTDTVPRHLVRGDQLVFGRQIHARILYPPPDIYVASADDAPIILQLTIAEKTAILFESDAGAEAEHALISAGDDLRSDILIKGQHYRDSSGTPEFLDAVQPKVIIASSSEIPLAEKIPEEWATDVQRRGIKLMRQDETGAIEIEFTDDNWQARAYLSGEVFRTNSR